MTACYYHKVSGLNDTISFSTDNGAHNFVSMMIEVKDIKHLASLERNPKRRRLMQERQFKLHVSKSILLKMTEGSRPEFELAKYDS